MAVRHWWQGPLGSGPHAATRPAPLPRRPGRPCGRGRREKARGSGRRGRARQRGARLDGVRVRRAGEQGLGVFAGRDFGRAEVVAAVPRRLCLLEPVAAVPAEPSEARPSAPFGGTANWYHALGCDASRRAAAGLAAQLLRQRLLGASAPLSHYCGTVTPEMPLSLQPLAAPPWDAALLSHSPLLVRLHSEAARCDDTCLALLSAQPIATAASERLRRWALCAVLTRSFSLYGGLRGRARTLAMVPFLDLLNHRSPCEGRSAPTCRFEEQSDLLAMVTTRAVRSGEELTFSYALAPDAALLCQYGIPGSGLGANSMNEAMVPVPPSALRASPCGAPAAAPPDLAAARLAALERQGWLSAGAPLLLSVPADSCPRDGRLARLARLLALGSAPEVERWERHLLAPVPEHKAPAGGRRTPARRAEAQGGAPGAGWPGDASLEARAWRLVAGWAREAWRLASEALGGLAGREPEAGSREWAVLAVAAAEEELLAEAAGDAERRALAAELRGAAGGGRGPGLWGPVRASVRQRPGAMAAEGEASAQQKDLSSLTVPQLKEKLKEANLPVSGNKAELIARLLEKEASGSSAAPAGDAPAGQEAAGAEAEAAQAKKADEPKEAEEQKEKEAEQPTEQKADDSKATEADEERKEQKEDGGEAKEDKEGEKAEGKEEEDVEKLDKLNMSLDDLISTDDTIGAHKKGKGKGKQGGWSGDWGGGDKWNGGSSWKNDSRGGNDWKQSWKDGGGGGKSSWGGGKTDSWGGGGGSSWKGGSADYGKNSKTWAGSSYGDKSYDKPYGGASYGNKSYDNKSYDSKSYGNSSYGNKSYDDKSFGKSYDRDDTSKFGRGGGGGGGYDKGGYGSFDKGSYRKSDDRGAASYDKGASYDKRSSYDRGGAGHDRGGGSGYDKGERYDKTYDKSGYDKGGHDRAGARGSGRDPPDRGYDREPPRYSDRAMALKYRQGHALRHRAMVGYVMFAVQRRADDSEVTQAAVSLSAFVW
ncbi:unnamed protein product [Prorocentrum cordatum]|uniref:SAP domain-containing protein n=1 Tax=Prorocentrum cordatum TaxID=2364126 RepID=A0ABN9PR01_9DINO|nr:unnamed protein product [Polarella glacialis]